MPRSTSSPEGRSGPLGPRCLLGDPPWAGRGVSASLQYALLPSKADLPTHTRLFKIPYGCLYKATVSGKKTNYGFYSLKRM